jgi:UPF0176 protein
MTIAVPKESIQIAALYRFARVDDCAHVREALQQICQQHGIRGTLLLAKEGINGTIAGSRGRLRG